MFISPEEHVFRIQILQILINMILGSTHADLGFLYAWRREKINNKENIISLRKRKKEKRETIISYLLFFILWLMCLTYASTKLWEKSN